MSEHINGAFVRREHVTALLKPDREANESALLQGERRGCWDLQVCGASVKEEEADRHGYFMRALPGSLMLSASPVLLLCFEPGGGSGRRLQSRSAAGRTETEHQGMCRYL